MKNFWIMICILCAFILFIGVPLLLIDNVNTENPYKKACIAHQGHIVNEDKCFSEDGKLISW